MSRTALLDIFLAFFLVAAVACLAADRDWFRNRLADYLERRELARSGRPVRSGAAPPAVADRGRAQLRPGARHASGTRCTCSPPSRCSPWPGTSARAGSPVPAATANWALLRDGIPAFVSLVVLSGVVYVATWASWLATSGGLRPQLGRQAPGRRTRAAARQAARLVAALPPATSGTSTPATSSTTPSTPTAPTRAAGW